MKIVFHNRTLLSGGIEKCVELLSKNIYKDFEIDIVYTHSDKLDPNIVGILSRYGNVYQLENNVIECDVVIWCSLYFDYHVLKNQIRAKKNVVWIHSMPRILPDCLLDDEEFIDDMDHIICVSEAVKNNLNVRKDGIVIHNFMAEDFLELSNDHPVDYPDNSLNLVVVSRLSRGKGFERLLNFTNQMKTKNIPFNIKVVGKGRADEEKIKNSFSHLSEVEFVGYQENPYRYIKNADYLIQLSDDESWCNVITEAKILGVPVIVTNFESAKEQVVHLENGIIVPLDETNYSNYIDLAVEHKIRLKDNLKDFEFKNELEMWYEIFK